MTDHTVIIGAGISGLSVALDLLERGHAVSVLDRGVAGGESSWAGGGILSPLLPWDYTEPVTALALASMSAYASWVSRIESVSQQQAEFWRCGMQALDVPAAETAMAWCAAHKLPARQNDLPFPMQTSRQGASIWLPEVAQVRNPRLVAALRTAVHRLGGVIHEHCPALGVQVQASRVSGVQTANSTFAADQVVIASGAWSGENLANLPAIPNIRPMRGQMLLFKLDPGVLDIVVFRHDLYLIPRRDGHVLVGSTMEDAGFDKRIDAATGRHLHDSAASIFPVLAGRKPIQHWSGLRPGSPDNIPVIDRHPDFDNVYVNSGHFRYGVTMAPAAADLLVSLMEETPLAVDPAPYSWQAALTRAWPRVA